MPQRTSLETATSSGRALANTGSGNSSTQETAPTRIEAVDLHSLSSEDVASGRDAWHWKQSIFTAA
jgi:hypothetical protein